MTGLHHPDMSLYPDGLHTASEYVVGGMFVETYPAEEGGYYWRVVRSPGQARISPAFGPALSIPPPGRHSTRVSTRSVAAFHGRLVAQKAEGS